MASPRKSGKPAAKRGETSKRKQSKAKATAPETRTEKRGRPTAYTDKIADEICRRLAEGESLNKICADKHIPPRSTVLTWVLSKKHDFSDRYLRAREVQAWTMADEIVDIADDGSLDKVELESGQVSVNHEHINRSRLRVDTRKWLLARLLQKHFGDRVSTEMSGPDGGPIKIADGGISGLLTAAKEARASRATQKED